MQLLSIWSLSKHFKNKVFPSIKKNNKIKILSAFTKQKIHFKKINIIKSKSKFLKEKANYIYISSINSNHFKNTLEVLKSNKNAICEKPICLREQDLQILKKAAKKNNTLFFEIDQYAYHPLFIKLKNIIKKKTIGKIIYVDCSFEVPLNNKDNFRFKKKLGGGALYDVGYYPVSILFKLFDSKKIRILEKNLYKEKNLDISGNSIIINEKKIVFNLSWSMSSPYKNFIKIYGLNGYLETHFIFSKQIEQACEIKIIKNGQIKKILIKKANQINLAFDEILKSKKNLFNYKYKQSLNILRTLNKLLTK